MGHWVETGAFVIGYLSVMGFLGKYRSRHSAWKNGCGSLIVVGLHENWTLAIRFQVSGFSRGKSASQPET